MTWDRQSIRLSVSKLTGCETSIPINARSDLFVCSLHVTQLIVNTFKTIPSPRRKYISFNIILFYLLDFLSLIMLFYDFIWGRIGDLTQSKCSLHFYESFDHITLILIIINWIDLYQHYVNFTNFLLHKYRKLLVSLSYHYIIRSKIYKNIFQYLSLLF